MQIKTGELTSAALDWAVALCECGDAWRYEDVDPHFYSTDWSQGGPIIEREKLTIEWTGEDWMAYIRHDEEFFGSTPLMAAMRCYVASKMGDTVDVPDDLV